MLGTELFYPLYFHVGDRIVLSTIFPCWGPNCFIHHISMLGTELFYPAYFHVRDRIVLSTIFPCWGPNCFIHHISMLGTELFYPAYFHVRDRIVLSTIFPCWGPNSSNIHPKIRTCRIFENIISDSLTFFLPSRKQNEIGSRQCWMKHCIAKRPTSQQTGNEYFVQQFCNFRIFFVGN